VVASAEVYPNKDEAVTVWVVQIRKDHGRGELETIEVAAEDFLDAAVQIAKDDTGTQIVKILGTYPAGQKGTA